MEDLKSEFVGRALYLVNLNNDIPTESQWQLRLHDEGGFILTSAPKEVFNTTSLPQWYYDVSSLRGTEIPGGIGTFAHDISGFATSHVDP